MIEFLSLNSKIHAFTELGKIMGKAADSLTSDTTILKDEFPELNNALQAAMQHNRWFTPSNLQFALQAWSNALKGDLLRDWAGKYEGGIQKNYSVRVAVIMAGNIPIVGFHDFLSVLMSGHIFIGKLSSDDKFLLPAFAELLCKIEPGFKSHIQFKDNTLDSFDAIIATGSNNTARYFEYYFSNYPHIIRKNRNGVAILSGDETDSEISKLGIDICTFFGLGCRNISKIFIPEKYEPTKLYAAVESYTEELAAHNKFMNNYNYQRSILLLNNIKHFDNGVIILKESTHYSSPISVVNYEYYNNLDLLKEKLKAHDEQIQCIANEMFTNDKTTKLGDTQYPGLGDYADGIDTMKFLNEIKT
jgi:hypothetical protein